LARSPRADCRDVFGHMAAQRPTSRPKPGRLPTRGGTRPTSSPKPGRLPTRGGTRPTSSPKPGRLPTRGGTRPTSSPKPGRLPTRGGTRPTSSPKPGRLPTRGGTRPTSSPDAGCLRTRWNRGSPRGPDHMRHSRRAEPRRPQGYAGWSRCPQVGSALCPAARRTGTLDPCGSYFRRRGPLSSRPRPCRPPQRGPPPGLRRQQPHRQRQRQRHHQRHHQQRHHQKQRGAPAATGLLELTPATRLNGDLSGRCTPDRRSFVGSSSRRPSGHPGTEASTCRQPSARSC
jgi:hypothetical protein